MEKTRPDISHSGKHNNTIQHSSLFIPGQPIHAAGEISPGEVVPNGADGKHLLEKNIALLFAPEPSTRIAAAGALGTLGDQRAIEPLFLACMDENSTVKQAAREALTRISLKYR